MANDSPPGRCLPLSPARNMVLEILHHGSKVPSLPLSKRMDVSRLAKARKAGARVSWTALFMKAYGLVAQKHPELRRAYIPYPRPHLYEHPISECACILEREHEGESVVLGAKFHMPEEHTLTQLHGYVRHFHTTPLHTIGYFRQWLRVGRYPSLVRRFLMWHTLNFSGYRRAKRLGTFAISSLGNFGVEQHHPISPLTTYLTFGPISSRGRVNVKVIYDHRVMDGRLVARCLYELEETLNGVILAELEGLIPMSQIAPSLAQDREPVQPEGV